MKTKYTVLSFLFFLVGLSAFAQTARVQGIVLDESNKPVEDVNVKYTGGSARTNKNGYYILNVPANKVITIEFTHLNLKKATANVQQLKPNENFEFNIVLKENVEQMPQITITTKNRKRVEGLVTIEPEVIRNIPGANPGVENILKSFGASSNNEMSTQYSVRGGNYDENLVYVNEIEIYRPFLVRSGQQEGLSFTNTDMIENVDFSAGGFQAKYGDKLSSVLDITYRIPTKFGASAQASLLGGSLTLESVSKNQKWTGIIGGRYRDNSLLVKSQETKTDYHPKFADIQAYVTFTPSTKWQWSFLGNLSQNIYNYRPTSRITKFGTFDNPIALVVDYEGEEKDQYGTYFGALKSVFKMNESFTLKFLSSIYHTIEEEYYDILAGYGFGQLDTSGGESMGDVQFVTRIGNELNHARNNLDALIANGEVKGVHDIKKNKIEWGIKYTRESIRDRVVEWQVIDSAGFSINPPKMLPKNDQPYTPYTGPLVPYQNVRATNYVNIDRFSGYAQWSRKDLIGNHEVFYNVGVRAQDWQVSGDNINGKNQIIVSPRAQFSIKPDWKEDMIFRISGGIYQQPPFYRELRDSSGTVNPDVKAQKSIHFVLGNDYSFKMWNRPFKLISEIYYKTMTDVNPYTLENVRVRYAAENNAVAYAKGFDMRLNGEFVPGTESWLSFGYMKNEENIEGKGYIPRPTDQRLKFGILFQDYMPNIPSLKLYLNLVYNTGLPGGSPSYADPYQYKDLRLPDYRRADVGFSYVLTENNKYRADTHWLKKFKDLSVGFEIYNLFDNQNSITNTWVRDVYTKTQYAVPNYLTTRVFNLKVSARL